jgi:hypothetical protein
MERASKRPGRALLRRHLAWLGERRLAPADVEASLAQWREHEPSPERDAALGLLLGRVRAEAPDRFDAFLDRYGIAAGEAQGWMEAARAQGYPSLDPRVVELEAMRGRRR